MIKAAPVLLSSKKLLKVFPRVFHQLLTEVGVRDGGHRLGALAQGLAGKARDAVLGRDILDHRARRGDRAAAGDGGKDVALALAVLRKARRVDADEALAALGAVRPLEEVHLAADAGELARAGALGIFLPHEVELHAAVDADDAAELRDALDGVDVVEVSRVEKLRLGVEPVVELLRAHGKVPRGKAGVELLARVRQLARLVELKERIGNGAGVAAEILLVGLGEHLGDRVGHAANAERQHRAVGDLIHHDLGDGDIGLAGRAVGAHGQRLMLALDDVVRFGQVHTVRAVHALELGIVLVDLEDHGAGALKDRAPGIVRNTEAAVAVLIRLGDWNECHIAADVLVAVEVRQRAQHDGHEFHKAILLELALVVADVPAVIAETLLLGVCFDDLDARADHKTAADLDVLHFSLTRSERAVEQFGKARAEAVVHPVAGLHSLNSLLRRNKFSLIVVHKNSPLVRIAFNVAEFSPLVNRSEAESDLKSCRFAARRIFLLRLRRDSAMLGSV